MQLACNVLKRLRVLNDVKEWVGVAVFNFFNTFVSSRRICWKKEIISHIKFN